MASVLQIGGRWRAQVRPPGRKSISRTFDTRREAVEWARRVETELDGQRAQVVSAAVTVGDLLREYERMRDEMGRPINPTSNTRYMLSHLAEDLGHERIDGLTPQRLVAWARARKSQGAGGYTVNMELSQLGTALRHTAGFLGLSIPDVVGAARPVLHYAQLISGGTKRTRRPNGDELDRLLPWLYDRNPVIGDAVRVAIITGMRRGEICRIAWEDLDSERRAVLVRHRKHPRAIEARDEWVPLLGESWDIVRRQAKGKDGRIFQISREGLTDAVTAGTRALGIPDLRLHDMRREATSTLREMGFDREARKAITGHRSDEAHDIYVAVTMESLHRQYDDALDIAQRPAHPRKAPGRPA